MPPFDPVARQRGVSMTIPAGSSVRWPCATAQRQMAEMRCLTLRAVSRFSFQMGARTAMTWPGVISETGSTPMLG